MLIICMLCVALFGSVDSQVKTYTHQLMLVEAEKCGMEHLRELGIELLPEMTPELAEWCFAVPDVEDESTYSVSAHPCTCAQARPCGPSRSGSTVLSP